MDVLALVAVTVSPVAAMLQTTTAVTGVASDGISGFTLGAAVVALLVGGYYLLARRWGLF